MRKYFLLATSILQISISALSAEDLRSKEKDYWKAKLSPVQIEVCREGGTERPFSGEYAESHADGTYTCSSCGAELFSSKNKFDSGTGWPSFTRPVADESVELLTDRTLGMERTEVRCSKCSAHLGHVFNDGPAPTGKRYCINSVCLKLNEKTQ